MSSLKSEYRDPEGRLRGECFACHGCAAYCPKPESNKCKSCSHVARDHALLEACHVRECNCTECVIVKNIPGECANCGHKVTAHTPTRDMKVARTSSLTDEAMPSTSSAGTRKRTTKPLRSFHDWMEDQGDSEDEFERGMLSSKKRKETDRKSFFLPKGKGKGRGKTKTGKTQKFQFSVLSGQGSTVPHSGFGLRVPEYATEENVLEMAAEKLIAMRKIDSGQLGHLLLCEGDGSWLRYVPGTKKPFVIRDYMDFRDMLPSKLHLYVMRRMDYIVLQKSKTKQCRDKHWKEARLPADQMPHTDDEVPHTDDEVLEVVDDEIAFMGAEKPRSSTPQYDSTIALEDFEEPDKGPNECQARAQRAPDTTHDYEYAKALQQLLDSEASEYYANTSDTDTDFNTSREQAGEPSGGAGTSVTIMEPGEKQQLLRDIVHDLHDKNIQKTERKIYSVRRDNAWESLRDKIVRKSHDPSKTMEVKFIGEEDTVDQGGPKNELFRLAFRDIFSKSGLFEQSSQGFLPVESPMAVYEKAFVTVGRALAMSVVHLGPSPSCLHPAIVSAICAEQTDMSLYMPVDGETAAFVEKLEKVTEEELPSLLQSETGVSMLSMAGWRKPAKSTTIADTVKLRRALCLQNIITSRKTAIEQLREGLSLFGVLSVLESEPQLAGALLHYSSQVLTADDIVRTFQVQWADEGSNKKERQKDIYERLTTWLEGVEEGEGRVSLTDFLTYVTALAAEPQTGWRFDPSIQFKECPKGCRCYPVSNTCALALTLPEHMATLSQQEFSSAMEEAIVAGWGFGRV